MTNKYIKKPIKELDKRLEIALVNEYKRTKYHASKQNLADKHNVDIWTLIKLLKK